VFVIEVEGAVVVISKARRLGARAAREAIELPTVDRRAKERRAWAWAAQRDAWRGSRQQSATGDNFQSRSPMRSSLRSQGAEKRGCEGYYNHKYWPYKKCYKPIAVPKTAINQKSRRFG
jgi:hypothetical protein